MYDYNCYNFMNNPLPSRFPDYGWVSGYAEWVAGAANFPFANPASAIQWLDDIRNAPKKATPANACPRVFVSHRQIDEGDARRCAWLSWDKKFDYWLDVIDLDPQRNKQVQAFQATWNRPLTPFEEMVLLAAIIEMAILNCTHVLALMTSNTAGSQWVPYEYGRVKDKTIRGAACWWDSTTLAQGKLPEYVHLADVHGNEAEISAWLQAELAKVAGCPSRPKGKWSEPATKSLPTG
jgi:hypothetical protein